MKRKAVNPSIPALLSILPGSMKTLLTTLVLLLTSVEINASTQADTLPVQGCDLGRYTFRSDSAGFDAEKYLSLFRQEPISDATFQRMRGKSYGAGCTVSRSELRYLFIPHFDGHGNVRLGEMVCNRVIADDLLAIFRTLFLQRYPIERMVLIDDYDGDDEASMTANNTSCFNFRNVSGSKTLSLHARGLAVDLNPLYNPMVDNRPGRKSRVEPSAGAQYADRQGDFSYKITAGDAAVSAFRSRGFGWGGTWKGKKDYQHFQRRFKKNK